MNHTLSLIGSRQPLSIARFSSEIWPWGQMVSWARISTKEERRRSLKKGGTTKFEQTWRESIRVMGVWALVLPGWCSLLGVPRSLCSFSLCKTSSCFSCFLEAQSILFPCMNTVFPTPAFTQLPLDGLQLPAASIFEEPSSQRWNAASRAVFLDSCQEWFPCVCLLHLWYKNFLSDMYVSIYLSDYLFLKCVYFEGEREWGRGAERERDRGRNGENPMLSAWSPIQCSTLRTHEMMT